MCSMNVVQCKGGLLIFLSIACLLILEETTLLSDAAAVIVSPFPGHAGSF